MKRLILLVCLCVSRGVYGFSPRFTPKNTKQEKWQDYLRDVSKPIVIAVGSAGTGKTLFSCQEALFLLHEKKMKRLILTRPTISVEDEEIGFLPGDIKDKMSPWTRPIYDNLYEFYTPREVDKLSSENILEVCPLGFMRGRTFRDTVIILDEAQNTTPIQMKMILTRIGHGSKLVINGDIHQSDIHGMNGLYDLLTRLKQKYEHEPHVMIRDGFGLVEFQNDQIIRHPIIEKVVSIYQPTELP